MNPRHTAPLLTALILLLAVAAAAAPVIAEAGDDALPATLADTGLRVDATGHALDPHGVPFSPQYPLWSDAADKQRWLRLPPGTAIDARNPDAWDFPAGTQLWKSFSHQGRPVETRYIERRPDGSWRFAVYLWNDSGTQATLAPARGAVLAVPQAPGGRYEVPARADCRVCHESAAVPVLGFGALQLSADRDPLAPHAVPAEAPAGVDLRQLVARGLLRGLPPQLLEQPPRIAGDTPTERAALGYLHGNCGHCHNDDGSPAPVALRLAQTVGDSVAARRRVLASLLEAGSRFRPAGPPALRAVEPGHPERSVLALRLRALQPGTRMPPLGTRIADDQAVALVERWIIDLHPAGSPASTVPLPLQESLP